MMADNAARNWVDREKIFAEFHEISDKSTTASLFNLSVDHAIDRLVAKGDLEGNRYKVRPTPY
jgi:head-tail adaptor